MPGLTGIEVAHSITKNPKIVFVTAYKDFAVKAFDLSAADYILKPFEFERIKASVDKVIASSIKEVPRVNFNVNRICFRSDHSDIILSYSKILVISSERDYVRVITEEESYLVHSTLENFSKKILSEDFIKVHRSHIINLNHLKKISKDDKGRTYVQLGAKGDIIVPVSQSSLKSIKENIGLL